MGDFIIDEYADVDMVAQDVVFQTGSGAINGGQLHVKLKTSASNCADVLSNPYRITPGNQNQDITIETNPENKNDQDQKIKIFPNPTNHEICIDANNIENISGVSICAVQGMQIISFNSFVKCIDVSQLNNGLYFISILQKNGRTQTFKFIKI